MQVGDLLNRLQRVKRKSAGGWVACCPAHDDQAPSLSIDVAPDTGAILLRCFAGCETSAIVDRLGLRLADLFPDANPPIMAAPATTNGKTAYRITDAAGQLVAVHWRQNSLDGKRMWWEQPDGTHGLLTGTADLPLYGLASLNGPASPVYLVEGERAAAALHNAGQAAVGTVTGASGTPSPTVLAALAGRHVILWPDNDDVGQRHMQRVGERLTGVATSLRWFEPAGLPPHGDAVEYLATHTTADLAADTERAPAWPATIALPPATSNGYASHINPTTGEIIDDTPPDRQARPWPRLRPEATYGLAGDVLAAIQPHTEADPAALLVGLLVSVGNIAGRGAHAIADGARHGLNEFALIVGDSAKARKDTARHQIRRLMALVDPDWSRERQAKGLSSGEGFIHAVRDRQIKSEKNAKTGQYEDTEVDPGIADKRLLVDESEFASVLKVAGRDGNTLSANIRTAWDGLDLRSMTKGNPLRASAPHISIIANITREEFSRLLSETDAFNGFINRYLIICARRSQLLPDGGLLPDYGDLIDRLATVCEWARQNECYRRDPGATALWHRVYHYLARERTGLEGMLLARAEAHLLRISCLYAAMDLTAVVTEAHLRAAIALWRYCEESVRYVFGHATGNALADRILATLESTPAGMSRTDILQTCGANNVTAGTLDNALGTLLRAKLVARQRVQGERGRPADVWSAVPPTEVPDEWDAVLAGEPEGRISGFT